MLILRVLEAFKKLFGSVTMATIRNLPAEKFPALVIIMRLHSNTQVFYVSQGESDGYSCFTGLRCLLCFIHCELSSSLSFITTNKALTYHTTTSDLKLYSVNSAKWLVLRVLCLPLFVCNILDHHVFIVSLFCISGFVVGKPLL